MWWDIFSATVFVLGICILLFNPVWSGQRFEFDEKELESEESLWKLYERWMRYHNVSRNPEEKQKRFEVFKEKAFLVHNNNKNKMDLPYKLELNMFADMIYVGNTMLSQQGSSSTD